MSSASSEIISFGKINLPANVHIISALTKIKGIGHNSAVVLLRGLGISQNQRIKQVSREEHDRLTEVLQRLENDEPVFTLMSGRPMCNKISTNSSLIAGRIKQDLLLRNNYAKKLRGYKGRQKAEGLKCRHQRSKSTGRKNKKVVKKK
jgi:ribosomal protein S13